MSEAIDPRLCACNGAMHVAGSIQGQGFACENVGAPPVDAVVEFTEGTGQTSVPPAPQRRGVPTRPIERITEEFTTVTYGKDGNVIGTAKHGPVTMPRGSLYTLQFNPFTFVWPGPAE